MRFVYEDCSRVSLTADAVSARAGVRLLGSANLVPQLLHTRFALLLFLSAATSHGRECRSFGGRQELPLQPSADSGHVRGRDAIGRSKLFGLDGIRRSADLPHLLVGQLSPVSASEIDRASDNFKMIGPDALRLPTEVIEFHSIRDLPNLLFIHGSMCIHTPACDAHTRVTHVGSE